MEENSMDKPITSGLRSTFLVHWVISLLLGVPLFFIPGRTLTVLGWVQQTVQLPEGGLTLPGTYFVDGVLMRVLGAALLALAWSSLRGWRAENYSQVAILVQMEVVFCVLGVVGFIAGFVMTGRTIPFIGYALILVLALFAIAWSFGLRRS
jgi:hypothetical protein